MKGIYRILNIENGKMYIGRSTNLGARFIRHITELDHGTHSNWKLQKAYNLLKDKSHLQFEILEEIKDSNLLPIAEQYYYDKYNVYKNGYNLSRFADEPTYDYETWAKTHKIISESSYKEEHQKTSSITVKNNLPPTLQNNFKIKGRKPKIIWFLLMAVVIFIIVAIANK